MSTGFQITNFKSQQFSIALISVLLDVFKLVRIRHSKLGMLFSTNIALALLRPEHAKVYDRNCCMPHEFWKTMIFCNLSTGDYNKTIHKNSYLLQVKHRYCKNETI